MKYLNNDILMEQVTTFDGTKALRRDCRFIKGDFYIKNKQCFFIGDKWYRINSNSVLFDHELQKWVLKEANALIHGIITLSKNGKVELGHFSSNVEHNVKIFHEGRLVTAISAEIFTGKEQLVKEGLNSYYYFLNDPHVPKEFTQKLKPRKDGFYTFPFNYESDQLIPEFAKIFEKEFKGNPLHSDAYKLLSDYTFGVEFETSKGAIPERFLKPNGLIACRDGSISGFEYTTVPLQGGTGIQAIISSCNLLKKYCSCSPNESLHIHIGNYPKTAKALASLYRLGLLIQHDVYSIFPYYYSNTAEFKRKSYCGPLPDFAISNDNANDIFNEMYIWLSGGNKFSKFPTGPHPLDRTGQQKWQITPRYVWLNFIPMLWGGRGTIEFRCHIPTISYQKVINWLFITVAILEYAKTHVATLTSTTLYDLNKITLAEILTEIYPQNISEILVGYVKERKKYYSNRNDIIGEAEILSEERGDNTFTLTPFV